MMTESEIRKTIAGTISKYRKQMCMTQKNRILQKATQNRRILRSVEWIGSIFSSLYCP